MREREGGGREENTLIHKDKDLRRSRLFYERQTDRQRQRNAERQREGNSNYMLRNNNDQTKQLMHSD